jgi:Rieske Fe-S protein
MRGGSGQTRSPWFASVDTPACEGRSVVVVDDGPIGGGQTGRTTAHLSNAMDDLYQTIAKIHGAEGARLAAESHTAAAQYADWLTRGDVAAVEAIAPGTGAVMRQGLAKVAVYRDERGVTHARSAVCPHPGCIVDWNHAERTWDCPCHGSRFDAHGRVINGPANSDLAEVQVREERRAS